MKIEGDVIVFECSGRKDYANGGILGISPKMDTSGGYDQGFPCEDFDNPLSIEERQELADYVITLWKAYRGVPCRQ